MSDPNINSSSYENIDPESKTSRESAPFTQINNHVINNIKNGDAFLVWCYLYSKSANWKTIKQNIKNVYGFGDVKIKQIFSYLKRARLIKYVQSKCAKGTFGTVQIHILNGSNFDEKQSFIECAPVGQKTVPAVNCSNGNDELLNKDITKEVNKHNTESNSAKEFARESEINYFDDFWKLYPVKKNKLRARKIWERKHLHKKMMIIFSDITERLSRDSQWQNVKFIPHPSSYLINELWNDDIIAHEQPPASKSKVNASDALSRVLKKHMNGGTTYDHTTGNTFDSLR